jgi:hypothetical protein
MYRSGERVIWVLQRGESNKFSAKALVLQLVGEEHSSPRRELCVHCRDEALACAAQSPSQTRELTLSPETSPEKPSHSRNFPFELLEWKVGPADGRPVQPPTFT